MVGLVGIFLRRSSISDEKVLFQVQVMKRKGENLTILKGLCKYWCKQYISLDWRYLQYLMYKVRYEKVFFITFIFRFVFRLFMFLELLQNLEFSFHFHFSFEFKYILITFSSASVNNLFKSSASISFSFNFLMARNMLHFQYQTPPRGIIGPSTKGYT